MSDLLAKLYPDDLRDFEQRADIALARGGAEHLLIPAVCCVISSATYRPYPFAVNPQFKHCCR